MSGFGLALDSTAYVNVSPPLTTGEVVPLHIVAATVPTPTLVAGRPQ